jgi:hypothetical protein
MAANNLSASSASMAVHLSATARTACSGNAGRSPYSNCLSSPGQRLAGEGGGSRDQSRIRCQPGGLRGYQGDLAETGLVTWAPSEAREDGQSSGQSWPGAHYGRIPGRNHGSERRIKRVRTKPAGEHRRYLLNRPRLSAAP